MLLDSSSRRSRKSKDKDKDSGPGLGLMLMAGGLAAQAAPSGGSLAYRACCAPTRRRRYAHPRNLHVITT